jgi:hypothetical protein
VYTAQLANGLYIVQVLKRVIEIRQVKCLSKRQRGYRFANIVELFNAANPAASAPGQRATALFQPHKAATGKLDLHFKAITGLNHVHAVDILRVLNDAFRKGKADGEQVEIFGRGHHHNVRDTVVDQGNRDFLRQKIGSDAGNVGRSVYRQFHNARRQWRRVGSTVLFRHNGIPEQPQKQVCYCSINGRPYA